MSFPQLKELCKSSKHSTYLSKRDILLRLGGGSFLDRSRTTPISTSFSSFSTISNFPEQRMPMETDVVRTTYPDRIATTSVQRRTSCHLDDATALVGEYTCMQICILSKRRIEAYMTCCENDFQHRNGKFVAFPFKGCSSLCAMRDCCLYGKWTYGLFSLLNGNAMEG